MVAPTRGAVNGGAEGFDIGAAEQVVYAEEGQALPHEGCGTPGVADAGACEPVGVEEAGGNLTVGRLALGGVEIPHQQ